MNDRDNAILSKLLTYCDKIERQVAGLDAGYETFISDLYAKDAIVMNILQIGELTAHLSSESKTENKEIWKMFRDMRNVAAHGYETLSARRARQIASGEVSKIKECCEAVLNAKGIHDGTLS